MAAFIQEKLADSRKRRFIYISHEHQDHFDADFLNSLENRDFTLIIARFHRPALLTMLSEYRCQELLALNNGEQVDLEGGYLRIFLDDSELNRDSAILVRFGEDAFLNQNDCKLFDALSGIVQRERTIQSYACQFSGATWHPTCYTYPIERYSAISRRKVMTKFETVARAIQTVNPEIFFPSAGPPCFLDPDLTRLNFEKINIFPHSTQLIAYLKLRLRDQDLSLPDPMPGDTYDTRTASFVQLAESRVTDETRDNYLRSYIASYQQYFEARAAKHAKIDPAKIVELLSEDLQRKLDYLSLSDRIKIPLYFTLNELPNTKLRVDFSRKAVQPTEAISEDEFYHIHAPAWLVAEVLDRQMTWEEFSLTFRAAISRNPDTYQPILHAYLLMDGDDLTRFCDFTKQIESNRERVIIWAGGVPYSVLRYCPHQGGDLSEGWVESNRFLTCPRHRWQFDLVDGGKCLTNDASIHAVCATEPAKTPPASGGAEQ